MSTETRKLSKRYSILLTQYTIGEKEYKYWHETEELISEENFLVVTQPYNVTGNIQNINNHNEEVSGYFTVASVTQTRIFVDKPDLDFYYNTCNAVTDPEQISNYFSGEPRFPYYWVLEGGYKGLVEEHCVDCTSGGGTVEKPYFWGKK